MSKKEITISELRKIIKEEVIKINRRIVLENEKKILEMELKMIIGSSTRDEKQQTNEGFIQNIAAAIGMLVATTGASQTVKDLPYDKETINKIEVALENPQVIQKLKEMGVEDNNIKKATKRFNDNKHKVDKVKTRKVIGDAELAKYLKMGYHLTNVQTDTVLNFVNIISPEANINETVIDFNEDAFFDSGVFKLGNNEIQKIKTILDSIENSGDVLLKIIIESSTDKQGLSKNLQSKLISLNYSGDNNGLSQIRNDAIMKILGEFNIETDLIEQVVLSEKGNGTIDSSARYVKIRLQILETSEIYPQKIERNYIATYPQTFEVIKAFSKKNNKSNYSKQGKTCKSSVSKFKKGQVLCPSF